MDTEIDIMTKAIVIRAHGGPEVLRIEDVAVGDPAAGELRVRQTAIGVNFHDCYVRSGLYKTLALPGIPGIEGAGVVEAVGPGVTSFASGDRIGYVTASYGSYAESRLLPAALVVKLPDDMPEDTAAAVFVKGLTAAFLVLRTHRILPGQTILVHAAAGGVGQLLCQWASHLGATVIGTVGSSEKAAVARKCGCAHTILYRQEDFLSRTKEITGGRGVDVAYDSVGRDTFAGSLAALALRGHIINFGQSSGPVAPFRFPISVRARIASPGRYCSTTSLPGVSSKRWWPSYSPPCPTVFCKLRSHAASPWPRQPMHIARLRRGSRPAPCCSYHEGIAACPPGLKGALAQIHAAAGDAARRARWST